MDVGKRLGDAERFGPAWTGEPRGVKGVSVVVAWPEDDVGKVQSSGERL